MSGGRGGGETGRAARGLPRAAARALFALWLVGAGVVEEPPLGLLPPPTASDNPTTPEKVALGKQLFFDPRLSGDGKRSCGTCHMPERAFTEPLAVTTDPAGKPLTRNTPTVLNAAYAPLFLWDGRARTLEEQALQPILDEKEMNASVEHVLRVVETDAQYVRRFEGAFGRAPSKRDLAAALAAYQRSLVSAGAPFDRWLFDGQKDALTPAQERGFRVYLKANCILCHEFFHPAVHPLGGREGLFTDFRFHNLGVGWKDGIMTDIGRFQVTQDPQDFGAFKTPTLRNVALTAPYMHDGSLPTLKDVVRFYNRGGIPNPNLDPAIGALGLTEREEDDLVEFLKALTSPEYEAVAGAGAR